MRIMLLASLPIIFPAMAMTQQAPQTDEHASRGCGQTRGARDGLLA
jgi:hypothetical protein